MSRIKNALAALMGREVTKPDEDGWHDLASWLGVNESGSSMSSATYYSCLKVLSESIAKMPMRVMRDENGGSVEAADHRFWNMLTCRANRNQSIVEFMAAVEMSRNHYGNALVMIDSKLGGKSEMWLIPWNEVDVWYDNSRAINNQLIWYRWNSPDGDVWLKQEDVIHLKSHNTKHNGLVGVPVLETLAGTLDGEREAQSLMNKLWSNGISQKVAVQYTADLDDTRRDRMIKGIDDYLKGKMKDKASDQVIPVPAGMTLTPLNQNMVNAQFAELKQLTALQIAAAFGIKPYQINNESKTAQGSDSQNKRIAFYVDTLLYIMRVYETEIAYKLLTDKERAGGFKVVLDTSETLRVDDKTLCEILNTYCKGAMMTHNECRKRMGLPAMPGGDRLIFNSGGIPIPIDSPQIDDPYREVRKSDNTDQE